MQTLTILPEHSPVTIGSWAANSLDSDTDTDTDTLPPSDTTEEAVHEVSELLETDGDFLINFVFLAFSVRSTDDIVGDHFYFE